MSIRNVLTKKDTDGAPVTGLVVQVYKYDASGPNNCGDYVGQMSEIYAKGQYYMDVSEEFAATIIIDGDTDQALTNVKMRGSTMSGTELTDDTVSMNKLTQAAKDEIRSGGTVTNNPDDVYLMTNGSSQITLHTDYQEMLDGDAGATHPVDKVGVYTTLKHNSKISLKDFGAEGDGVTDDSTALENFLNYATGKNGALVPNGTYKIETTKNVLADTHIIGENFPVIKGILEIDGVDNVILDGLHFQSWNSSYQYCVYIRGGATNVIIRNCKFSNNGHVVAVDDGTPQENITMINCHFESPGDAANNYDSLCEFRNCDGLYIAHNLFNITNADCDSHIKVSTDSDKVLIENNVFLGDPEEEVCDLYTSGKSFIFRNNYCKIGDGGVVSYKPTTNENTPVIAQVVDNVIIHTGTFSSHLIMCRGAEGLTWEGEKQQAIVKGNQVYTDNAIDVIRVEGLHLAIISDNIIYSETANDGAVISVQSTLHANIHNNIMSVGYLQVTQSTVESYPESLAGGTLIITENQIIDPSSFVNGCMRISTVDDLDIVVKGNIFHLRSASNAEIFRIDGCDCKSLIIVDNAYQSISPASANETPTLTGNTYEQLIYKDNSWGGDSGDELTISSGSITVYGESHIVDTESDASTDDLTTINGGREGQFLILRAADDARTVVVKDGTLKLAGGDFSLTHTQDRLLLHYTAGNWHEVSRSDNYA